MKVPADEGHLKMTGKDLPRVDETRTPDDRFEPPGKQHPGRTRDRAFFPQRGAAK